MNELLIQIASGVVVAVVSFGFGYFLFRSQTNEEIRLEVYRRRLNAYENIVDFLDDLDTFSHQNSTEEIVARKDHFFKAALRLDANTRIYVPSEFDRLMCALVDNIHGLPDSLAYLEEVHEQAHHLIEKDVGQHLANWRVDFIKKDKSGRKFDEHFKNLDLEKNALDVVDKPEDDPF